MCNVHTNSRQYNWTRNTLITCYSIHFCSQSNIPIYILQNFSQSYLLHIFYKYMYFVCPRESRSKIQGYAEYTNEARCSARKTSQDEKRRSNRFYQYARVYNRSSSKTPSQAKEKKQTFGESTSGHVQTSIQNTTTRTEYKQHNLNDTRAYAHTYTYTTDITHNTHTHTLRTQHITTNTHA